MGLSNYGENKVLDDLLEASLYFAVFTSDPGETGSLAGEPSGNGYARVAIAAATWDAAGGGVKSNGTAITFPEASGSWGTITHWAILDASTGGNMFISGELTAGKTIASGQTLNFAAGSVDVTAS